MAHRMQQETGPSLMDAGWVKIQQRTFTRWCNTFLSERMLKIEDLCGDFSDGVQFCNLLEVISGKKLPKWNAKPRIKAQKLENVSFGLQFLKKEGIKLVAIGPEDVVDAKLKLILGLIWTIILRYQIQRGEDDGGSARSELLKWVRSKIPEYDIKNFGRDWNSGKAICALAEAVEPGQMNLPGDFENDPLKDATMGMSKAEENMDIPMILFPEDMVGEDDDELSVMTYISYFRDYEAKRGDRDLEGQLRRTPVADQCRAYGPGLEGGEALIPGIFIIEARNHRGELIPMGGFPFTANVVQPNGQTLECDLEDNGDGTVNATYVPNHAGTHVVNVQLGGQDIGGADGGSKSPFKVEIGGAQADASKTQIFGPGIEGGNVGDKAEFTVKTFNRFGAPIHEGGSAVTLDVAGPVDAARPKQVLRDNGNGEYSGEYLPMLHGAHTVMVKVNDETAAQCPIEVMIDRDPNAADASQSWAEQLNDPTTIEPVEILIHAVKPDGSAMTSGGEPFDCECISPQGDVVPSTVKDNGDGTYAVQIECEDAGDYKLDLFVRNKDLPAHVESIKDHPRTLTVEPGVSTKHTVCEGPGLEDGILDTQPTYFDIITKDAKGRPCGEKGVGQPFEVTVEGPDGPVPVELTDNGDGTYRANYEPKKHGNHHIEVKLKEDHVANSPYDIRVNAGAWAANSGIKFFSFVVETKTRDNEPSAGGESDNFAIAIEGPGDPKADLSDLGGGDYQVKYSLPEQGKYKISVKINGEDIRGSPMEQNN